MLPLRINRPNETWLHGPLAAGRSESESPAFVTPLTGPHLH
jgi:hypothetical protein